MSQGWIAQAPVIIVVVSEPHKAQQLYGVRGERLYSVQNCAAVAQNMLLAAHSQGLASCWIGAFDEEAINRTLQLGHRFRPQIVLPIGYADEVLPEPMRLRIEHLVLFEDNSRGGNGGGGRVEDLDWAVYDYNILGRAINKAEESSKKLTKTGKSIRIMVRISHRNVKKRIHKRYDIEVKRFRRCRIERHTMK